MLSVVILSAAIKTKILGVWSKHSSLSRQIVNYGKNRFITLTTDRRGLRHNKGPTQ
jgi:hypothetical protein